MLGWKEVGRNEAHPVVYVSDGEIMLSLWATNEQSVCEFSKNKNVGLHHVAFRVESEGDLNSIHDRLLSNGVKIKFAPEQLGQETAKHTICYEPSGIRLEFIWPGN